MNRLLYEHSTFCRGYLIIPFQYGQADSQAIYSYRLLSEIGHKGHFHTATNPAKLYSDSIDGILQIARDDLTQFSDSDSYDDYFKRRYTYRDNLIIVIEAAGTFFYDHYPPTELTNIAAPKLFESEAECLNWIRQGIDRISSSV
ncbi:hypothetical protein IQ268_03720 [Oculatella sp. LEGE 06141]|uniref:hypothetical protein n=1 Tax=Oculatella sp. LEGE 06141 TaxID=1828648 RepID=UPI001881C74C|nr:hypothetical protein [Oculatella sp. LEGE 06141]MBE9177687.1 hypothetical protein [Oculatella sp. LEGE 06141]